MSRTDPEEAGHSSRVSLVGSPVPSQNQVGESPQPAPDFDTVYAELFPFVWRCLRGLGVPDGSLDDACQDVFLVVHRRLREFSGKASVRTWLYGIVRKVASNQRRTSQRKGQGAPLDDELPSVAPSPHDRAEEAEVAAFVRAFLDDLEPKRREVFLLALLEGMSIPEVATALSIPVNTAYTRVRLVRTEFEKAFAARHGT